MIREFSPDEQVLCVYGHPVAKWREPVEHDVIACQKQFGANGQSGQRCDSRTWVLQLDGGRRLAVTVTERTAQLIRERRMRPAEILDMLGLLKAALARV